MITFLNDKRDWKLRAEFYQCIVGVASYIGWQSTSVLQPLIEQVKTGACCKHVIYQQNNWGSMGSVGGT